MPIEPNPSETDPLSLNNRGLIIKDISYSINILYTANPIINGYYEAWIQLKNSIQRGEYSKREGKPDIYKPDHVDNTTEYHAEFN